MHTGKPRAFLLELDIFLAIVSRPSGNGWSVGAVVAQYLDMVEVTGSNPVQTTIFTLNLKSSGRLRYRCIVQARGEFRKSVLGDFVGF